MIEWDGAYPLLHAFKMDNGMLSFIQEKGMSHRVLMLRVLFIAAGIGDFCIALSLKKKFVLPFDKYAKVFTPVYVWCIIRLIAAVPNMICCC